MALTRPRASQINTVITNVTDPIIVLNNGSTVANIDVGLIMNRNNGTVPNVALFWDESANTFVTSFTTSTGSTNANIAISSYANLRVHTIFGNIGGLSNVHVSGSLLPSANVTYDLGSPTLRWRDGWFSGTTIHIGSESMSVDENGRWSFTSKGNTVQISSTADFNPPSANIAGAVKAGDFNFANGVSIVTTLSNSIASANLGIKGYIDAAVSTVSGNANVQFESLASLTSNAAVQAGDIATLFANAAAQAGSIATLTANAGAQAGSIATLTANAAAQAGEIANLWANAGAQSGAIVTANSAMKGYVDGQITSVNSAWQSNTGALAGDIATLFANAGTQSGSIATILANLGAVSGSLSTLTANAGAQAGDIATLYSNAATQAGNIATIFANLGSVSGSLATLTANAGAQAGQIVTANTAMKGYVDAQITNLVNGAPATLDTLNELATALGNDANLSVTLTNKITNAEANITTANSAMKGYVDGQISSVTSAWQANAGAQAGDIATLFANAGAQSASIATLTSNAAAQAGDIATLFANAGAQAGSIATLTANAAAQAGNIATIFANLGAVSGSISTLTSNAAAQAGDIATLFANAGAQSGQIVTANTAMKSYVDAAIATVSGNANVQFESLAALTSNAAVQAGEIANIYANLGSVSGSLATLTSNAAVQAGDIATLFANAGAQSGAIVTANTAMKGYVDGQISSVNSSWQANAAVQAGNIATIFANLGAVSGSLATLTANAGAQAGSIATLTANAGAQAGDIATLYSNAATQAGEIANLWANAGVQAGAIVTANTAMKGYVDGQITNLVNGAPATLDTLNELAAALGNDANLSVTLTNKITNAEANITTANSAMKGYVDGQISSVTSAWQTNAAVQAGDIATLFANAAVQAGDIATLFANAGAQSGAIVTANTAMKGYVDAINSTLTANAGAQAGSIATLTSNAAVQAGNIATIFANLGAVSGSLATLTSNAAAQAGDIATLFANAGAQSASIASLNTTKANLSGAVFTGGIYATELWSTQSSGDEGGQLNLAPAVTNTTISGNIVIDVYQNRLRIFESGGTNRGGYYDITTLAAGVGSNLSVGIGGAGTYSNTDVQAYLTTNQYATLTDVSNANTGLKGYVDGYITSATANANSQQSSIGALNNAVSALSGDIVTLYSNAAVQAGIIASLTNYSNANVTSYLPTHSGNISATNANITANTTSTSSTTGALRIAGGVGVAGNIYTGGRINVGGTNGIELNGNGNYITAIGSALALSGGGGAAPNITAYPGLIARNQTELDLYGGQGNINLRTGNGNSVVVTGTQTATSTTTGALRVAGGAGIVGNVWAGNVIATNFTYANGQSILTNIDSALSTLTSNAAAQAGDIATLFANAGAQSGAIVTANTAMKGYVDAQITNLVNGAPATLDTLNELAAALGNDANLSVTLTNKITNAEANITTANTAMKGYVDGQISSVTSAWQANAGAQAGDIATLFANAGAQAGSIATLTSNAAVQAGNIATIFANLGSVSGSLATLTSNAASQAGEIANLWANAGAQSGAIVTANTAMKGYVDSVANNSSYSNANVGSYLTSYTGNISAGNVITGGIFTNNYYYANGTPLTFGGGSGTYSNTEVQAYLTTNQYATQTDISTANTAMKGYVDAINSTLTANAGAQAGSIATLTSNAAVQAGDIATLFANAGAQAGSIATLTSNAAVQAGDIATLFANAAVQAGNIATIFANLGAVSGSLATLTANAGAQAGSIATLTANAGAQAGSITDLYTIKANLANPTFTNNVTVQGNLIISGNLITTNVDNLQIDDSMIYMAENNATDFLDIGIVGSFTKDTFYQHTGVVRDATDGYWKFFANVQAEPTTTIDFGSATYSPVLAGNIVAAGNVVVGANLRLTGALLNSAGLPGTNGQYLTSTGTGVAWTTIDLAADNITNGTTNVTANPTSVNVTVSGTEVMNIDPDGIATINGGLYIQSNSTLAWPSYSIPMAVYENTANITAFSLNTPTTSILLVNDDDTLRIENNSGELITAGTDTVSIPKNLVVGTTASTDEKLTVRTTRGNIVLGNITSGSTSTDSGILFTGGGALTSGIFTEVSGNILSYGINMSQITSANTAVAGGLFRLDVRSTTRRFSVVRRPAGSATEVVAFDINLDNGLTVMAANVLVGNAATAFSNVRIAHTTPSTSSSTGALQVLGGAGVAGNVFVGGMVDITSTTASTSTTTGALIVDGGVGIASNVTVGGNVVVAHQLRVNSGNFTTAIVNSGTAGVGNIGASGAGFNTVFAKATSAQYADLAEIYTSDRDYIPGTVLIFGGEREVTMATESHDPRVAGVVSTNPAYIMNNSCDGVEVALQGRVPTKVQGPVAKGDRLVTSSVQGAAERLDPTKYQPGCIIGKALEAIDSDEVRYIEVVVGRV